jgi:limonene-1,2-epoxide hydrolase
MDALFQRMVLARTITRYRKTITDDDGTTANARMIASDRRWRNQCRHGDEGGVQALALQLLSPKSEIKPRPMVAVYLRRR